MSNQVLIGAVVVTILTASLFLVSCKSIQKFPVSSVAPAADMQVSTSKDKNGNNILSLQTNHLASPERIATDATVYVVWAYTAENGLKNLGVLKNLNGKKATTKLTTPFNISEIFITAEQVGNISEPKGKEINRLTLPKK